MKKSDCLFLIIGTNPMPNLISLVTRLKKGGEVYLCYTEASGGSETKDIANRINDIFNVKQKDMELNIKIFPYPLSKNLIGAVEDSISSKLNEIYSDNKTIELNYTGGTKVMSSGAYHMFKDFSSKNSLAKLVLTYIDGEIEVINYEVFDGGEWSFQSERLSKLDEIMEIKIDDIFKAHNINIKDSYNLEPFETKVAERLFNKFIDCSEEEYCKTICYLEYLFYEKCRAYNSKSKKKKIPKDWENINAIEEDRVEAFNIFRDIKTIEDLYGEKASTDEGKIKSIESLGGKWLEDWVFKLLLELKSEGEITEVFKSLEGDNDESNFEVDLVAYRRYKLFAISTTCIDKPEDARNKLYEIKERSRQLGGSEAGICFINLCKSSLDFEREVKSTFDDEISKNILVIGVDRFKNIKDELRAWIRGE